MSLISVATFLLIAHANFLGTYGAKKIGDVTIESKENFFNQFDTNNNKSWSEEECRNALLSLYPQGWKEEEITEIFKFYEKNEDKKIIWDEYGAFWEWIQSLEENMDARSAYAEFQKKKEAAQQAQRAAK